MTATHESSQVEGDNPLKAESERLVGLLAPIIAAADPLAAALALAGMVCGVATLYPQHRHAIAETIMASHLNTIRRMGAGTVEDVSAQVKAEQAEVAQLLAMDPPADGVGH